MNRYPLWKYAIIVVALLVAALYTLPNLFGEAPAVQVSAAKVTAKVDSATQQQVESALKGAGLTPNLLALDSASVLARFDSTDDQLKARDLIEHALNPDTANPAYVVALNLVSRSPAWLGKLNAKPMYLGLDLRGGVHFMLQVDMRAAITKRLDSVASNLRVELRKKDVRHGGVSREGDTIEIRVRDAATLEAARRVIADTQPDLQATDSTTGEPRLMASFKPQALLQVQNDAVKQNITTLHKRVNELGVAEPVIQQQGADRVVVQLPGVQDTAKAKDILGRTATLEMRLVDESTEGLAAERNAGPVPFGSEKFLERDGRPVIVKRQVILTGESLSNAQPGFDEQQRPKVDLTVDANGGAIMKQVSSENLKKRMAIILFEKGKGEALTAPVIQSELGNRFQISGSMSAAEATDLALLLRAGALAAPMEIIEERTIGPSLGVENINKGFHSVAWGFVVICVFMCVYSMLFGAFSSVALAFNLL
ncbi:MAG: protein translocase subunit SecD, partial [Burkholderiaceae bacterium]|nr:protein translocase subunit SecD [Burkholderiaceae bacterium]